MPRRKLIDWVVLALILAIIYAFGSYNYGKVQAKAHSSGPPGRIGHAISQYKQVTGRYPRSLREVVEASGNDLPTAHYTGRRYQYFEEWPVSAYTRKPIAAVIGPGDRAFGNYSYLLIYKGGQAEPVGFISVLYYGKLSPRRVREHLDLDHDRADVKKVLERAGLPTNYALDYYTEGDWSADDDQLRIEVVKD